MQMATLAVMIGNAVAGVELQAASYLHDFDGKLRIDDYIGTACDDLA
jgi:hypothetical protein